MKNKRLETVLYSAGGVLALFAVIVAVNFIGSRAKFRVDLTADKAFTLSEGTKTVLRKLDTPVQVRLYVSQKDNAMPVVLKNYASRVEDLLNEYSQISGGKLEVSKMDPEPDSDGEDSAKLDGVEPQMLPTGDRLYLGIAINMLDQKVALPFLSPDRERLLEYDLTRAISIVGNPTKPVMGLMSGLPVNGGVNPAMMRMGQMQPQEPWIFVSELKRDFTVKPVEMTAEKIDDDIKVLVVFHPKDITDAAQFALDQFVLRGGKLIAFVDPSPVFDKNPQAASNPMFANMPGSKSSLDKLFTAWGITFDSSKVLADMTYKTKNRGGDQPAVLRFTTDAMNKDDVATSQIDDLVMLLAGTFSGTPKDGLKQTVLIHSSPNSMLADGFMAAMSGEQIGKDFKPENKEFAVAIQLAGKFKTAFPDGQPGAGTNAPASTALKESTTDTQVILVGDTDMMNDQIVADIQEFMGQRIVTPRFGNLNLLQSFVEKLSGDNNLISIRSRATMNRPFTRIREMESRAQEQYRGKIKALEDGLAEAQKKLNDLQAKKDANQRFILSPEQKVELDKFRKEQAQANKDLKKVRRDLNLERDSLENRLKWTNILGMPAVVAVFGMALAVAKRKRTAAK